MIRRLLLPPRQPVWYSLMAILIVVLGIGAFNIWYTNYVSQTADRRWCSMLSDLDDAYRTNPPVTATGRKIAANTAEMRRDFGCGVSAVPMGTPSPLPTRR